MRFQTNRAARFKFLLVEIETGLTFARIARSTNNSKSKFERNLKNARKAYESAVRFRRASNNLDSEQKATVDANLEQLRNALENLGEAV